MQDRIGYFLIFTQTFLFNWHILKRRVHLIFKLFFKSIRSHDSAAGIATRLQAEWPRNWTFIEQRKNKLPLHAEYPSNTTLLEIYFDLGDRNLVHTATLKSLCPVRQGKLFLRWGQPSARLSAQQRGPTIWCGLVNRFSKLVLSKFSEFLPQSVHSAN